MVGKSSSKVLLAIINAYYDTKNGYSHCSVNEINKKFGISLKNIPEMFRQLEVEGYIRDCTVSGYYKRFKILNPYLCPDFILDERLNTPQKNFLLRCLEQDINEYFDTEYILTEHNSLIDITFEPIVRDLLSMNGMMATKFVYEYNTKDDALYIDFGSPNYFIMARFVGKRREEEKLDE